MRQGCAGGFDSQQVIQVRSRPHGRPPDALGGRRLILALCVTAKRSISLPELKTVGLFLVTALAEIVGCYLPYLWLREGKTIWLLVPGALSLAAFAWLLSLHPTAAGRVYAAYGGVYIFMAILWLWTVDGVRPTMWDLVGTAVALSGMAIIMFAPRSI